MPQTLVFLGAKKIGYQCLMYLIEKQEHLDFQLLAVFTKENILDAEENTISRLCEIHHIAVLSDLSQLPACDILLSVQYHQILRKEHLAKAGVAAINLHMAPLPEYRGCNQFSFAILDQKDYFGTTLHLMTEGIDDGDILWEQRFSIPLDIFVKDLYELTEKHSLALFQQHLPDIIRHNFSPVSQQSVIPQRGTSLHYRKEIETLKQIDLAWDKEQIWRYIRATYFPPFQPPFAMINERKIYFVPQEKLG
ncbi:MAG: formyltransferase family protein [Chitinophagales bacterium]|nr:hypothetical protein [Bacteroidota bacterium]MCB9044278.1 hypothetical protein [Chitinophagales bacterium]